MPIRESGRCPHEPRPGTVVCLYCRHEEHVAGAGRRRARGGVIGAALLAAVMIGGALLRVQSDALVATADAPTSDAPAPAPAAPTPVLASASLVPAAPTFRKSLAAAPAPVAPSPARQSPIVAEGRTTLPGGLFAVRTGDTVEVHFDTPDSRTRRSDKFERIVRETLPAVYGAIAGDALADVPAGQLVDARELLEELPERGVRLRTAEGGTLVVWPATRPGRDGPLVITYRATVLR